MARTLSDQLRRSLFDRCKSFKAHLETILTNNSGAPTPFVSALDLVRLYADSVEDHVNVVWETYNEEFDRLNEVKARLSDLNDKELTIDRVFARQGHNALPRSLARRIGDEFAAFALTGAQDLSPVLTVGAPGRFETRLEDWRGYLFHNLWASAYEEADQYRQGNFAVITVPYLEGTRAFWEPLVLGHEVGHVVLYYKGGQDVAGPVSNSVVQQIVRELQLPADAEVACCWVQELLCDLNMVRLYGPAGVAALGDMLSVAETHSVLDSPTHPPRALRLSLMLNRLGRDLPTQISELLEPWWTVASEELSDHPATQVYISALRAQADVLWREVETWADGPYDFRGRIAEIDWLAKRLASGIPGGLAEEEGGRRPFSHDRFESADVVNAGWVAERIPVSSELPENTLDRLALKALDTFDFVRLWQSREGAVEREAFRQRHVSKGTGLMSGPQIAGRLSTTNDDERLVVTPLLERAIGDAGLDVRLSSSFIVFRHSAIAVFDAIQSGEDPRELQESVEKEWGDRFILHPGELVLASTLEYVLLPLDIVGQLVTRSSYGRLGLITATAVQVQPGSCGAITLELVNLSRTPLALRAGQRIAELVLHQLPDRVEHASSTTYRYATGPKFSHVQLDWDNDIIDAMRTGEDRRGDG
jgi:deoxycytidine triphosphate deaminase